MATTLTNLFWKFSERTAAQMVSLVVSIVLARILNPSDYGSVAMVMVFVSLASVLVEGGFSSALIQKKDADKLDFSTVFYFSLVFSIFLYLVLFFIAPYISQFYGEGYEILTPVLRVIGLQIIIYGVNSVQQAYVSRKMMFKKFFWSTLLGTIISALVGLIMAYSGYGIWALVGQQLTMVVTNTLVLYIVTRKLPGLMFSFNRLKRLFGYGVNILGTLLLINLFLNIRSVIIGKLYSAKDLAYFDRGNQFPSLLVTNVDYSIAAVLFPKMSQEQDDKSRIKQTCRNSIRFSSFVMMPLMMGMIVCAEPMIRVILTDKWIDTVPYVQLFCITYMFYPMHTANMQAIKAIGKSGMYLTLEIIKKIIEVVCLLLVMKISVQAIAINMAVLSTLFIFVNAYPNIKYINYSVKEQLSDIAPSLIMSLIMAVLVYSIGQILPFADLAILLIQIITGCFVYIMMSYITHNNEFTYIRKLIVSKFNRK